MNILELIQQRQSSRVRFDPDRTIPEDHLKQILEAARWAPTAHNMQNFQIVVVDDRRILGDLSTIPARVSRAFIAENYEQLAFSEEELKERKKGLLATMFPPSWVDPVARAAAPTTRSDDDGAETHHPDRWTEPSLDAQRAHTLLGGPTYLTMSAALLVVLFDPRTRAPDSEGDALGMMSLGCVMENMWLVAESLGIAFQIQSILGIDGVEQDVKRVLGIPLFLKVGFAVRLGYPAARDAYLRVRRNMDELVHHNRFGRRFGVRQ
jgi:nitroreductase